MREAPPIANGARTCAGVTRHPSADAATSGSATREAPLARVAAVLTLVLDGDLDLAGLAWLEAQIGQAERLGAPVLVLDLRAVAFIDLIGAQALFAAAARARAAGRRLVVDPGSVGVRGLLGLLDPFGRLELTGEIERHDSRHVDSASDGAGLTA